MIGVIDYGSGNVSAIMNILKQQKIPHFLSGDPKELSKAERYILPGVGAFGPTIKNLMASGVSDVLNEQVLDKGKKILGICVGMHLLADSSDEGCEAGLGWIKGNVTKIDARKIKTAPKLPHMGWSSIESQNKASLLKGIDLELGFYFLHSYYFNATDNLHVSACVEFGEQLPCIVEHKNIHGVQFHPEKSHSNGVRLLTNFAELI